MSIRQIIAQQGQREAMATELVTLEFTYKKQQPAPLDPQSVLQEILRR